MKTWDRLSVEKLVAGGFGLARSDEGVVLVTGACAGESLQARQIGTRSRIPLAQTTRVLEPSEERVSPSCPLYNICGGCNWQHLSYEAQLFWKEQIFSESLQRLGRLTDIPPIEIFRSPPWNYRIRAQMKIDHSTGMAGFFKRKSNDVVDVPRCPLLEENLNGLFQERRDLLNSLTPETRQVRAIVGDNGSIASDPVVPGKTVKSVTLTVAKRKFEILGTDFFQGNGRMLQPLGTWARQHAGGSFFVDMYGGTGFFSILLGENFERGLLVEAEQHQVNRATNNFRLNGIEHIEACARKAEHFFGPQSGPTSTDLLVVDPPRAGLTRAVREGIGRMAPESIFYVSCNPPTQARDIGFLVNRRGYRLKHAALFDLYPQTHHLETAVILTRR